MATTFTIEWGYWLVPSAVTAVAFMWAANLSRPSQSPSYADGIFDAIVYGAALIISLIAWLLWSLFR